MFVGAVQRVAEVEVGGGACGGGGGEGRGGIKVIMVFGNEDEGEDEGEREAERDGVDVGEGTTGITIVNAGPAPIPGEAGKVTVIISVGFDIGVGISLEAPTVMVVYAVKVAVDVTGGPVTSPGMRSISVMVTRGGVVVVVVVSTNVRVTIAVGSESSLIEGAAAAAVTEPVAVDETKDDVDVGLFRARTRSEAVDIVDPAPRIPIDDPGRERTQSCVIAFVVVPSPSIIIPSPAPPQTDGSIGIPFTP